MLRRIALLLACPALVCAQTQPTPVKPGWQWTMDSVRTVVNAVRAGRSLAPATWPGGARVAVLLSFDVDNETIPLRFGEPTNSGVRPERRIGTSSSRRRCRMGRTTRSTRSGL